METTATKTNLTNRSWLNNLSRETRIVLHESLENYLKTDQLVDYKAYPKQAEFHRAGVKYRNRLLHAGNQALANDTPISTQSGHKLMGDLEVGDFVVSPDGPARIEKVIPQGVRQMYRVTTTDGSSLLADKEHLWAIRLMKKKSKWSVVTTGTIMALLEGEKHTVMLPPRPSRKGKELVIKSIEKAGMDECTCIQIASEEGIFLAGKDDIPTHNCGKTFAGGAEMAMHLTGEYPSWWKGLRFDRPITAWAASVTGDATRDNCQRVLLGRPKQIGTGWIPKRCLTSMFGRARGVSDLYDYYMVRHISGGLSMLRFRYYAQDREAWQGPPVDFLWWDEECPREIYEEGLARTIAVKGSTIMTFTPLLGSTPVVNLYLKDHDPEHSSRYAVRMRLYDVLHLSKEEIDAEIARWPEHQRRARIEGLPAAGLGQIFPYLEEHLAVDPFEIPDHWPVLGGIDVSDSTGTLTAHPTAAVKIAWDRDNDCVYVVKEYRRKGLKPAEHWLSLRRWGKTLKWAWPRDALKVKGGEAGTGAQLIEMYRNEGMKALPIFAQFRKNMRKMQGQSGGGAGLSIVSIERGVMEMQTRMETGGFKVFRDCKMFFEEMLQYHRDEDMKIVREADDILDATRYALMMLRFADVKNKRQYINREQIDPIMGI